MTEKTVHLSWLTAVEEAAKEAMSGPFSRIGDEYVSGHYRFQVTASPDRVAALCRGLRQAVAALERHDSLVRHIYDWNVGACSDADGPLQEVPCYEDELTDPDMWCPNCAVTVFLAAESARAALAALALPEEDSDEGAVGALRGLRARRTARPRLGGREGLPPGVRGLPQMEVAVSTDAFPRSQPMSDLPTVEERLVDAARSYFAQVRFRLASMPEGEFVMGWLNALASRGLIVIDVPEEPTDEEETDG